MQKLIFQTESLSQCHLKIQICMQKLLQIGRLLFLIISVCPNFLQLSIESKSQCHLKIQNCMQKLL